jgi:hypothetical protein
MKLVQANAVRLLTVLVSALAVGACAPSLDADKAAFCRDLNSYASAVNALNGLTAANTVDDYRKAQRAVDEAGSRLDASASKLNRAEGKAVAATQKSFQRAVNGISSSESIAAANEQIRAAAAAAIVQYLQITQTTCTYGASP